MSWSIWSYSSLSLTLFRSANSHLQGHSVVSPPAPPPSLDPNAPVVEALGRIPLVPQLVLPHSLLERPALLGHLVVPSLLSVLDEDVDRVPA